MVIASATGSGRNDGVDCCRFLQTLIAVRLRTVGDPNCRRHLTWASDMAAAVSMMTERMAAGDTFDAYVEDVAAFWRRSLQAKGIRLEVRGRVGLLADPQRLPLAVILHELLSNTARHAFVDQSGGAVAVAFTATQSGLSVVVRDTGVGAAEVSLKDGLSLVEGLIASLGGTLSIETTPGSGFATRIALPPVARAMI